MSVTSTDSTEKTVGQSVSGNEPSMEDILASIRRIIAEDQSNGLGRGGLTGFSRRSPPSAARPETPPDPVASDVLTLRPSATEEAAIELPPEPKADDLAHDDRLAGGLTALHQHDEASQDAPSFAPLVEGIADHHDRRHEPIQHGRDPIVSDTIEEAHLPEPSLLLNDDADGLISTATGASVTSSFQVLADSVLMQDPGLIERIMRETLRPMLKTWLDDHLPNLVERLVRAEIERVARGGRAH